MLRKDDICLAYFFVAWTPEHFPFCSLRIGDSAHQTLWEFLTLLMVLHAWGARFTESSLLLLGDNTGSLNDALKPGNAYSQGDLMEKSSRKMGV